MKKYKKAISVFIFVPVLLLAACGKQNTDKPATSETQYTKKMNTREKLVIAYTSAAADYPADQAMVEEAVQKIVREKLNIDLDFCVISENYSEKISSLMAGHQQLHVIFFEQNSMMEMHMKDQLVKLDDLLAQYGSGIINAVGNDVIDTCRIGGNLYGIPANRDYAVGWDGYILQKDILDKYGIKAEDIETIEDLEEVFAIIKMHEPEMEILDCGYWSFLNNQYFVDSVNDLPFGVLMNYGLDRKLSNVFETEEYMEALQRIYRWRQLGYIKRSWDSVKESTNQKINEGRLFAYACRGKPGIEQQEKRATGKDVVFVQFGENAVVGNPPAAMNWGITQNTVSAEKSMELLNLLYTDEDIMNLLCCGIEGIHYVKTDDGHITFPPGKNQNPFTNGAWRMPNQFITYVWEGSPLTLWDDIKKFNEETLHSYYYGFNFDPTPVSTEYIKLEQIYRRYQPILENGLVNPEEGLEQMNRELDANFIDEVIAEKQRQFDAFCDKREGF